MTADLKGKTALVTGSGKKAGIGYGIVRKLAYWMSRFTPNLYERLMARQLQPELIRKSA